MLQIDFHKLVRNAMLIWVRMEFLEMIGQIIAFISMGVMTIMFAWFLVQATNGGNLPCGSNKVSIVNIYNNNHFERGITIKYGLFGDDWNTYNINGKYLYGWCEMNLCYKEKFPDLTPACMEWISHNNH